MIPTKLMMTTVVSVGLSAATVPGTMAVECDGEIVDRTLQDVSVPPGGWCTLALVTVKDGNVKADKAKSLVVVGSTIENGDIEAVKVEQGVAIIGTTVTNGNIRIEKSRHDSAAVQLQQNHVLNGDIRVRKNTDARLTGNHAGNGSIEVEKNRDALVFNNRASGDIHCVDNGRLGSGGNRSTDGDVECP